MDPTFESLNMTSPQHVRLSRTSPDLCILSMPLAPPSPILMPDDLLSPCTSGEIPIFFDLELLLDETFSCLTANACILASESDDGPNNRLSVDFVPTFDPIWKYHLDIWDPEIIHGPAFRSPKPLPRGHSIRSISPVSKDAALALISTKDDSRVHSSTFGGFLDDQSSSLVPRICEQASKTLDNAIQQMVISDKPRLASFQSSPNVRQRLVLSLKLKEHDRPPPLSSAQTYSTLPTPYFAPPSPSPSLDLISPISPRPSRYQRPLERSRAVRISERRPRSPMSTGAELEAQRRIPHALVKRVAYPCSRSTDSSPGLPLPPCPVRSLENHGSGIPPLPKNFLWLRSATIELWIDQEGFRAIKPIFHFVGYSPRSRSLHPFAPTDSTSSDITGGIVEFMPVKRDSFVFHYAALDGPPALRMLTVNGNESRDHISRQVTLNVKYNGVYTVVGAETSPLSIFEGEDSKSHSESVKLPWRFEYLVGDRRGDARGKIAAGEKVLSPLTFSCSPYVLHPFQGKRTGLMNVVKKNLIPKLNSERLVLPMWSSTTQAQPQCSKLPSTWRMGSLHGRSRSDAYTKAPMSVMVAANPVPNSPLGKGKHKTARGANHMQYTRRRRASSAGEHSSNPRP